MKDKGLEFAFDKIFEVFSKNEETNDRWDANRDLIEALPHEEQELILEYLALNVSDIEEDGRIFYSCNAMDFESYEKAFEYAIEQMNNNCSEEEIEGAVAWYLRGKKGVQLRNGQFLSLVIDNIKKEAK